MQKCVISDCMDHNIVAVHTFQKVIIDFLKHKNDSIKKIIYFSDRTGSQYKDKKIFANQIYYGDFQGIEAKLYFFAANHGKSACDGIGRTIKRLARKASLQRSTENQILTSRDLHDQAKEEIKGIEVFFVEQNDVHMNAEKLKARFAASKT